MSEREHQHHESPRAIRVSPAILLAGLFGVLLGTGGFTFIEGEGLSYLGDAPATCAHCHIMRDHYDSWQKSSHHAWTTCNDCHVPQSMVPKYAVKALNGFNHSKAFTLQRFHEPIQIHPFSARIVQQNCLRCHGDLVSQMLVNARHDEDDDQCARCHDSVGHGPKR